MLSDGAMVSRFRLGVWFVLEDRDRAFEGSSGADNPFQERTEITVPLLTFDVRLSSRFGVQAAASLPDVTRSATVPAPSGAFEFRETFSGLGDTSLVGWYKLRPISRWHTVLNFGTSVPTGRTETPRFRSELQDGSLVPMSRLQRGTGTFDPLVGASVTRRFRTLTVFGSLAARLPIYQNGEGLRTGASSEANLGLAREIGHERFTGLVRLGWLHREQDVFRGTPVLVGGGDWLYVTPGIAVLLGKGVNAQVEVKLPVHRSLANRQLDSRAVFQFGVTRGF